MTIWRRFCAVLWLALVAVPAAANADIMPALRLEFQVQESSLNDLMEVLTQYAKRQGVTVENIGLRMPPRGNRQIFYVTLMRRDTTILIVTDFLKQGQMLLGYYRQAEDVEPDQLIESLLSELKKRWPDIHAYTGP